MNFILAPEIKCYQSASSRGRRVSVLEPVNVRRKCEEIVPHHVIRRFERKPGGEHGGRYIIFRVQVDLDPRSAWHFSILWPRKVCIVKIELPSCVVMVDFRPTHPIVRQDTFSAEGGYLRRVYSRHRMVAVRDGWWHHASPASQETLFDP